MLALSAFAAVLAALLLVPFSAAAAGIGPGYQQPGKPLNHLGGYLTPDGHVAYCIDAGLPSAVAHETDDSGVVDSVNGLAPPEMLRLNTLLARHGDTSDANTAAAVAMAVWSIAGNSAYRAEGGDAFVLVRAPAEQRMVIQALADQFRAEGAAITAPAPTAVLSISIDEGDDYGGILTLDASPEVTGTVELINAVFADTGARARAGIGRHATRRCRCTAKWVYRVSGLRIELRSRRTRLPDRRRARLLHSGRADPRCLRWIGRHCADGVGIRPSRPTRPFAGHQRPAISGSRHNRHRHSSAGRCALEWRAASLVRVPPVA